MKIFLVLSFLVVMTGCASQEWSVTSTTPINNRKYTVVGEVSGDCSNPVIDLLLLNFSMGKKDCARAAVDEALAKAGADALIDVTVTTKIRNYVFYKSVNTEATGKAIKFQR
jgi:hypothetical protein